MFYLLNVFIFLSDTLPMSHQVNGMLWNKERGHFFIIILAASQENVCLINPLPNIDAFWRLCSRQSFENIVTKEEIAQNEQFLLLPQCFPLLVIGYPFNYRDFLFFYKICSKSSAELSYEGKGLGFCKQCRFRSDRS